MTIRKRSISTCVTHSNSSGVHETRCTVNSSAHTWPARLVRPRDNSYGNVYTADINVKKRFRLGYSLAQWHSWRVDRLFNLTVVVTNSNAEYINAYYLNAPCRLLGFATRRNVETRHWLTYVSLMLLVINVFFFCKQKTKLAPLKKLTTPAWSWMRPHCLHDRVRPYPTYSRTATTYNWYLYLVWFYYRPFVAYSSRESFKRMCRIACPRSRRHCRRANDFILTPTIIPRLRIARCYLVSIDPFTHILVRSHVDPWTSGRVEMCFAADSILWFSRSTTDCVYRSNRQWIERTV